MKLESMPIRIHKDVYEEMTKIKEKTGVPYSMQVRKAMELYKEHNGFGVGK